MAKDTDKRTVTVVNTTETYHGVIDHRQGGRITARPASTGKPVDTTHLRCPSHVR